VIGAGIALFALAGSLNDDGNVYPNSGIKNLTPFTYTVTYTLDPEEDAPDVLVIGYLGGNKEWDEMRRSGCAARRLSLGPLRGPGPYFVGADYALLKNSLSIEMKGVTK